MNIRFIIYVCLPSFHRSSVSLSCLDVEKKSPVLNYEAALLLESMIRLFFAWFLLRTLESWSKILHSTVHYSMNYGAISVMLFPASFTILSFVRARIFQFFEEGSFFQRLILFNFILHVFMFTTSGTGITWCPWSVPLLMKLYALKKLGCYGLWVIERVSLVAFIQSGVFKICSSIF